MSHLHCMCGPANDVALARMRELGVYSVRQDFGWTGAQWHGPAEPLRWHNHDPKVAACARQDVQMLALLAGTPRWARDDPARPHEPLYKYLDLYGEFVTQVVGRYGRGGTFWDEHPELPRKPIFRWEIWNEPNLPRFCSRPDDPAWFAGFVLGSARLIRDVDPEAFIVSGGLSSSGKVGDPHVYLARALEAGLANPADAIGYHPYAAGKGSVRAELEAVRGIMTDHGRERMVLYVTEFGWGTGGNGHNELVVSEAGQATRVEDTYEMLENHPELKVPRAYLYNYQDLHGDPSHWAHNCGVLRRSGSAKPSFDAFSRVAR